MKHFIIFCLIVFFDIANADDSIQDLISEDCPKAFVQLAQMSLEKRQALAPTLLQVIESKDLNLQNPNTLAGSSYLIPMPGKEVEVAAIWKHRNPLHQNMAKHCALQILAELGAGAADTLPTLLNLSADNSISQELRQLAEEAALKIAKAVGPSATTEYFNKLFPAIYQNLEGQGHNLASFFDLNVSVPAIINQALRNEESQALRLAELLAWLDPTGQTTQAVLLSKLQEGQSCDILLDLALWQACPGAELADLALKLATTENTCRAQAFQLLAVIASQLQNPPTVCVKDKLAQASDYVTKLNLAAKEQIKNNNFLPLSAIFTALSKLAEGRNISALSENIKASFELTCKDCFAEHPAIGLLTAAGRQAAEIIFSTLKQPSESKRELAAKALPALKHADFRDVEPCLNFIADRNRVIAKACLHVLLPHHQAALSEAAKLIRKKELGRDREFAAILVLNTLQEDNNSLELLKTTLATYSCQELSVFESIAANKNIKSILDKRVLECLAHHPQDAALINLAISADNQSTEFQTLLDNILTNYPSQPEVILKALKKLVVDKDSPYIDLLKEIAISQNIQQCEAIELYWRLESKFDARKDFLKEHITKISHCLSNQLEALESILLQIFNSSSEIERVKWLGALGNTATQKPDIKLLVYSYLSSSNLDLAYQALVAYIKINSLNSEINPFLIKIANSKYNWQLAKIKLSKSKALELQQFLLNSKDKLAESLAAKLDILLINSKE